MAIKMKLRIRTEEIYHARATRTAPIYTSAPVSSKTNARPSSPFAGCSAARLAARLAQIDRRTQLGASRI